MKKIISVAATLALAIGLPMLANAATLSTPLSVGSTFPGQGSTLNVSGDCGSAGANNSVQFSLMQGSTTTTLPTTNNLSTGSGGAFSGSVTLPSSFPSGQATLVATCNANGDVIYSPTLTFPATASTSFTLPATTPTSGGTFNVSGACGGSNGTGTSQLTVANSSGSFNVGSVNLSPTGTFSNTIILPTSLGTGPATLTAHCSNGTAFSSAITVNPAAVNSLSVSPNPTAGNVGSVAGSCGTGNANGTASFALLRNGSSTSLSATNVGTDANGNFNSVINFPAGFGSGPASLVVTCPNGATFANAVSITDPGIGGLLQVPADTGSTTTTTPVGGVNAGAPKSESSKELPIIILISGLTIAGLTVASRIKALQK